MSGPEPVDDDVWISIDGVSKRWPDGAIALTDLDLHVAHGDFVAVIGPSGSGKSTLLAMLAGWCEPTHGSIWWDASAGPDRWSGTSIVPQAMGLVAELTVRENIELPTLARGVPSPHVAELVHAFDLEPLIDRYPDEISFGQQQRTAIARALVDRPKVVLVDEPTSHQDGTHADAILDALRRHAADGHAVVMATHDVRAMEAASRIVELGRPR